MDNKKKLQELEEMYDRLANEHRELSADLEGEAEYTESINGAFTEAAKEEVASRFPEQYAKTKRKEELEQQLAEIAKQLQAVARECINNLDELISTFESRIADMDKQKEELEQESKELKTELAEAKSTEAYLTGEENALQQVENIERQLRKNRAARGQLTRTINTFTREIESIKTEKDELTADIDATMRLIEEADMNKEEKAVMSKEDVFKRLNDVKRELKADDEMDAAERNWYDNNIYAIEEAIRQRKYKGRRINARGII